jgi:hypothetical protein
MDFKRTNNYSHYSLDESNKKIKKIDIEIEKISKVRQFIGVINYFWLLNKNFSLKGFSGIS